MRSFSFERGILRKASPLGLEFMKLAMLCVVFTVSGANFAHAVPSFARQTGLQCQACHTAFPQLTPLGRSFKLSGYTLSSESTFFPPIAVGTKGSPGFTHTKRKQPKDDIPGPFRQNNNTSLSEASLFYGGRLFAPFGRSIPEDSFLNRIGFFGEVAYDGAEGSTAWDNVDLRYAQASKIGSASVTWGLFANNNPGLDDVWNTTPVYRFPFSTSGLAPESIASPLLDGGFEFQVGGLGAYVMIANHLYLAAADYFTLAKSTQQKLGIDTEEEPEIRHGAPYYRVAWEQGFGPSVIEVGTTVMIAQTFPGRDSSQGHDRMKDVSFDVQYQYSSALSDITLASSIIQERQTLHASQDLGLSANRSGSIREERVTASYLYQKTYSGDVQYFNINGRQDPVLYGDTRTGKPDTKGWIFELSYLPFNRTGGPKIWPYTGVKLSVQYTVYQRFNGSRGDFDGDGRNARDNNTLFFTVATGF